jgi:hypothetical protein
VVFCLPPFRQRTEPVVDVAQSVELQVVDLAVAGSIPVVHPSFSWQHSCDTLVSAPVVTTMNSGVRARSEYDALTAATPAGVAELVDALDLGSGELLLVEVQVLSPAPPETTAPKALSDGVSSRTTIQPDDRRRTHSED